MNCFTVLGLEPAASLDADDLQQKYREHLKAGLPVAEEEPSAQITVHQAYETLRDPVKRLAHLLALNGSGPSRSSQLPGGMMDLFSQVSGGLQSSAAFLQEARRASSPLTRALLAEKQMATIKSLQDLLAAINSQRNEILQALPGTGPGEVEVLQRWHGRLAFLEKWRAQIQERLLQFVSLP